QIEMLPWTALRENVRPSIIGLGFRVTPPQFSHGCGGVLFSRRRFLRWRAFAPPAPISPCLNQLTRNIRPSVVSPPGTNTMENFGAGVHRKISRLRPLKLAPPEAQ